LTTTHQSSTRNEIGTAMYNKSTPVELFSSSSSSSRFLFLSPLVSRSVRAASAVTLLLWLLL
jgi:hypothetical protein